MHAEANKQALKQLLLDQLALDAKISTAEMAWMEASEAYDTAMADD